MKPPTSFTHWPSPFWMSMSFFEWEVSNLSNGYKPLRDLIGKLYGYSNATGGDTKTGRTILYRAMNQLDRSAKDGVPDFLYNWTRPGGYQ